MGKALQIRDMPEDVHEALRAKAARAGMSLSAYARTVLERDARRPSIAEVLARPGRASPEVDATQIAALIRADRGPLRE